MSRVSAVYGSSVLLVFFSMLMPIPYQGSLSSTTDIDQDTHGPTVFPHVLLPRFDKTALPPAARSERAVARPLVIDRPANPIKRSVVRGVVRSDKTSMLLVENQGRLTTLREGDVFLGFQVISISERFARFDNGEEQVSLALPQGEP